LAIRLRVSQIIGVIILALAGLAIVLPAPALAQDSSDDNLLNADRDRRDDLDREDNEDGDDEDREDGDERDRRSSADENIGLAGRGLDAEIEENARAADLDDDSLLEGDLIDGDFSRRNQTEIGPYDPLGIRLGSFLFFPEFEADRRHSDNVFESSTIKRSDWSTRLTPSFELRSNWSRHELVGGFEYEKVIYDDFSSEDEENNAAALSGRIDIGRRSSLEAETSYESQTESRGDINVPNNAAQRPTEITKDAALQANHVFNRLSATLRGQVTEEEFGEVSLIDGGTFDNAARDNTERELTGRLTYELIPGVAIFAEGSGNEIELARANANGLKLDSTGWAALGGFSLDFGGIVTGDIAAGFAQQTPDNDTLQGVEGAILAANVIWAMSPLTNINFNAAFNIDTTTLANSIGSLVQTVGVEVEHAFRTNMVLTAGVAYEMEDFASVNLEEKTLEVAVEGEYRLNRMVGLVAGYEFTDFSSTSSSNDYQENLFLLGLRLRR
jgi:hypothetical protein